jgi:regulatory protein
MMLLNIILSIQPKPRRKDQYVLALDDGRSFSVHKEVVAKYRLKSGMEIDEERLNFYIWEANLKTAGDLALKYLGYRSRTKKQLYDYLKRKGFEDPVVDKTIEKMQEYGFLNDEEFALRWVESRKTGRPAGRRKIAYELKAKGIDEETLESALNTLTEEEEQEQALKLAEKASLRYKHLPSRERMARISQTLMRRGFGWDIVERALRQLPDDEPEPMDY